MASKKSLVKVDPMFDVKLKALLKPCKTKQELYDYISYFFELKLPDCTVSRYADTNPFDIIWHIYNIAVNGNNPKNEQEILCVAGRGSGKCSAKNSIILTNCGPKYIQNIKQNDLVWTGWNWKPVVETFDEGIKDGVTVKTNVSTKSSAFDLTGSLKHRVQAVNKDNLIDWIYMKDLVPGQLIYKSAHSSFDVDQKSEDFEKGWLIGVITGDGCVSRHGNGISVSGADFSELRYYTNLVYKYFNIKNRVKRTSKKAVSVSICNKTFRQWFDSYIDGDLCYFKKLRTLEHSPDFLAGFISGLMDTDGSKDSITLANPDLIQQISQILAVFGVHSSINHNRRKPRYSQFIDKSVTYSSCEYKTRLPDYLLPLFSKREIFIEHRQKQNEQFRYPSLLIKPFAEYIKKKYKIGNGYWTISGKKSRSKIPYSKDLWGSGYKSKEKFLHGYKIDSFIQLAKDLNENEWINKLQFIRNGFFEEVDTVTFGKYYFYDLEVADDHAYWSNGFISHNTLGMAIVELLLMLHDSRDVAHVGAILAQAKRCYEYQLKFMLSNKIRPLIEPPHLKEDARILQKMNMEKSTFKIKNDLVSIEVIPCTIKATNGLHCSIVVVDEIDTVSGEGMKAFKEISGMVDSRGDTKALRVGISTRKSRYGLMNKQIENAEQEGRSVYKWTALEFSQRCPDSISGTTPIDAYIIQDSLECIPESEFLMKDAKKQKEYVKHQLPGTGCMKCPAAAICLGDAKKQESKSPMLKPITDFIQKIRTEGADWAISQLMNLKPSIEGIVYKEFDERVHVKTWNEMWFRLTGVEFPGECTHDIFVKKCHQLGLACYSGIDWGWSSPSTVVYFFVDKRDNVYVVRTDGMRFVSNPEWINYIKNKYHPMYKCQLYFPDVADPGSIVEMKKVGLPTVSEIDKTINTGIQIIKKALRVPGTSETKVFIAKETCSHIISEFGLYHFKTSADGTISDLPDTEDDHWLDAFRYPMTMLFGKTMFMMASDEEYNEFSKITDSNGNYTKVPTAKEFAMAEKLHVNTEIDNPHLLGKVATISELIDEDMKDDNSISSGGILWSF